MLQAEEISVPIAPPPTKPEIEAGIWGGQCVSWIQKYFDSYYKHPKFRGHAKDIEPNSQIPEVGSVVLTMEPIGHAALIIGIEDNQLIVAESNYGGDEMIDVGRKININDPRIRGYYKF